MTGLDQAYASCRSRDGGARLGFHFAGRCGVGSFPPPGKIAYTVATPSSGVAPYTLFTARTDGTGVTRLTSPGLRRDIEARWSPDGERVAFTRVEPDGVYSTIWVVNADGSEAHLVGENGYAEHPQSSPDGRWIAYQAQGAFGTGGGRDDTTYDLWIVRPDGSGDRALDAGAMYGSQSRSSGTATGGRGHLTASRSRLSLTTSPLSRISTVMSWRCSTSQPEASECSPPARIPSGHPTARASS